MLVAIFGERESHAVYLLNQQNIARLDIVNCISHGISKDNEETEGEDDFDDSPDNEALTDKEEKSALDLYTVNLNDSAAAGNIDPLVGREEEIERTAQILCRRKEEQPLVCWGSWSW